MSYFNQKELSCTDGKESIYFGDVYNNKNYPKKRAFVSCDPRYSLKAENFILSKFEKGKVKITNFGYNPKPNAKTSIQYDFYPDDYKLESGRKRIYELVKLITGKRTKYHSLKNEIDLNIDIKKVSFDQAMTSTIARLPKISEDFSVIESKIYQDDSIDVTEFKFDLDEHKYCFPIETDEIKETCIEGNIKLRRNIKNTFQTTKNRWKIIK